jgi:hypothetical protein
MPRQPFTQRVADYFKARPGIWIDARDLETVGGRQAWRTRVSDCRREFLMNIQNRTRRVKSADGTVWTRSEYRYMPFQQIGPESTEVRPTADGRLF